MMLELRPRHDHAGYEADWYQIVDPSDDSVPIGWLARETIHDHGWVAYNRRGGNKSYACSTLTEALRAAGYDLQDFATRHVFADDDDDDELEVYVW